MTQSDALSILETGVSAFLTGEPGSGKTHTIARYCAWLRARGIEPAITASTGIAATHLHGMTVHAWSGIGIHEKATDAIVDAIASKEHVARRIQKTSVLIIDEISMLSADTFDLIDAVCREVRRSDLPFGGMQVVLVGDFFQLPPVRGRGSEASFAFTAQAWKALNPIVCYLEEQHRQEDPRFLSVLSTIRRAEDDPGVASALLSREADEDTELEDIPRLHTHNADVDRVNEDRLARLPGASKVFRMSARGGAPLIESLKRGCLSPETLVLKDGAVVMGTKNIPTIGLANGTLGVVVGFGRDGSPTIETRDGRTITVQPVEWVIEEQGKVKAAITQVPLRLAWAMTVHKSQGMSMDAAAIDLARAFEYGQGYVALSRVRSLDGLYLLGWSEDALRIHPDVLRADGDFRARSAEAEVYFHDLEANGERRALVERFVKASGGSMDEAVVATARANAALKTHEVSIARMKEGVSLAEIAKERGLTLGTIGGHAERGIEEGKITAAEVRKLLPDKLRRGVDDIADACGDMSGLTLTQMRERTKGKWSFDELRLARIVLG